LVAGHLCDALHAAVRPADFQVGGEFGPEAEMQAKIIYGVGTGLAQDGLCLFLTAVAGDHGGADRTAVGPGSDKLHLEPVAAQLHTGQVDAAVASIEALRAEDPQNSVFLYLLGIGYLKRNQADKGRQALER
jgi:hypothetical protein